MTCHFCQNLKKSNLKCPKIDSPSLSLSSAIEEKIVGLIPIILMAMGLLAPLTMKYRIIKIQNLFL